MRDIIFKAKRVDNGEWIEGGYAEHDGKSFIVIWTRYIPDTRDWDTVEYYENNPCYNSALIEVIPETVCQYTGLKDENGNKVFENDILNVIYSDPQGECHNTENYLLDDLRTDYILGWLCYANELKIVGNKFDNPELL